MPAKPKSSAKKTVKHPIKKVIEPEVVISPPQISHTPPPVAAPAPPPPPQPASTPPPVTPITSSDDALEAMLESEPEDETANHKNTFLFIVGILISGAIIVAAIVVFSVYMRSSTVPKKSTASTQVTPKATPAPMFVRSLVTFEVLNGSGIAGAATKAAAKLVQAGYTVLSVGNSKKQEATEIFISASVTQSDTRELMADISSMFSTASATGALTGSTASARLILGSK
jgi:hypothetical protein